MSITAPNYVQGQYSVADRDRIFTKADKYPDASGGITNQVPTLAADGSIIWRQQSSGGGDGTANANIAVVEDTSTASQAYAVGDLLVYSGQLYRVTADIAQGGTITPGTNVTPTTVADELENGGGGGGGVTSFNSRTGAVLPQAADYPPSLIGAAAASDIAPAEESPATAAHAKNSFLIYNGQLYRVTSAISIGDTLTVGTNIAAADVGTYLAMVAAAPNAGGFAPAGYGLGAAPTTLTSADDLNNLYGTSGWYFFQVANPPANTPPSDGSTYNWVVRVDNLFQTAYGVRNAPATDYCPILRRVYYNTWGPWEYFNPPLIAGQEYRTTERFLGKPVYVKAIDLGNLPNNTYKVLAHSIANCVPLRVYGRTNAVTLPYSYNGANYTISATSTNIIVTTNNDASSSTATAVFYYTKSTD